MALIIIAPGQHSGAAAEEAESDTFCSKTGTADTACIVVGEDTNRITAADRREHTQLIGSPGDNAIGWDLRLTMEYATDMDLIIYDSDPRIVFDARRRATCDGTHKQYEFCRILGKEEYWAKVILANGETPARYRLEKKPIMGPALIGTNLVADDSITTVKDQDGVAFVRAGFTIPTDEPVNENTFEHIYKIDLTDGALSLQVHFDSDGGEALVVSLFDSGGKIRSGPSQPSYHQVIYVDLKEEPLGEEAYVVLALDQRNDIFARPEYAGDFFLQEDQTAQPIVLDTDGFFRETGTSERNFSLRLDDGFKSPAVIGLEGPGYRLVLSGAEGQETPEVVDSGRGQVAYVGGAIAGFDSLLGPLTQELDLRIEVKAVAAEGTVGNANDWQLTIRNAAKSNEMLVIPISTGEVFGEISDGTHRLAIQNNGRVIAKFAKEKMLRFTFGKSGSFYARLGKVPRGRDYDLAICNRFGQVIAIGDTGVHWQWSDLDGDLYLVAFPGLDPVRNRIGDKIYIEVGVSR